MDKNEFSGIFIDIDKFDFDDETELNNTGIPDENKYIITSQKNSSENVLCKIYNPDVLQNGRKEGSPNKSDQASYAQLQVLRESLFLKKLTHPTIIQFKGLNLYNTKAMFTDLPFDTEEDEEIDANPTLFLEYAEKGPIQSQFKKKKLKLEPVKRQICIIGITAAVRFLHKNKIVHRNLNPNSIWLDSNLYPKIFDFSHSREISPDEVKNTVTKLKSDKSFYFAPEALEFTIDPNFLDALDIFALGRLIYLFAIGYEPFTHPTDKNNGLKNYQLEKKIIDDDHATPYFPANFNPNFKELLKSCWQHNANERPNADFIYKLITINIHDFLIDDFNNKERDEISKYIYMINEFEENNKTGISLYKSFEFDIETKSVEEMFKKLDDLLENKTVESNEDEFLRLIKELSTKKEFHDQNYLPKVMKYVVKFLDKNNYSANEFIESVFGGIEKTKKIKEITEKTFPKDSETVNISSSVKKISAKSFAGYEKLKLVFIPKSVEIIENEAFINCKKLTYVYLPDSIKDENLGERVFSGCVRLNNITLPSNLSIIKKETFNENKSLTVIELNKNLQKINELAFSCCESLKEITIPDSVKFIGKNAFKLCTNLETLNFNKVSQTKIKFIKLGRKYKK